MQAVDYTGNADVRIITAAQLATAGFSSPDLVWNKSNAFQLTVSDAIAAYLVAADTKFILHQAGLSFATLFRRTVVPPLRVGGSAWTPSAWSLDATNVPTVLQTFEHGHVMFRGSGGTGVRSNRRDSYAIPGSPGGYSRIKSRWFGRPYTAGSNFIPQRGHVHGNGIQADGKRRGLVAWHDITFGAPWIFNLGIWQSDADGNNFTFYGPTAPGSAADLVNVSAAARTTNVVTLTVPTGHGFVAGDLIFVDLADNSYDGTFQVSSVTATTVVYSQTAANAGTTTGTAQLVRSQLAKAGLIRNFAVSAVTRASGVVTATVPAGHTYEANDWINVDCVDNTYDGQFKVRTATATTLTWNQAAADAGATTGTVEKIFPYIVESEWRPNHFRARAWPEAGINPASGVPPFGAPSWESIWGMNIDLTTITPSLVPDPTRGVSCDVLVAHLTGGGNVTELGYDAIECEEAG